MQAYPKVEESLELLKTVGWAMGDVCVEHPNGRVDRTGQRSKHWIIASAPARQRPGGWLGDKRLRSHVVVAIEEGRLRSLE